MLGSSRLRARGDADRERGARWRRRAPTPRGKPDAARASTSTARRVSLEEASSSRMLRDRRASPRGGAEAATEAEKAPRPRAERILEGPQAPRAAFTPVAGFAAEAEIRQGRTLGSGVDLVAVQTEHDEEPVTSGRAYLYFWPGGETERASRSAQAQGRPRAALTVIVSPLTGRATHRQGPGRPARAAQRATRKTRGSARKNEARARTGFTLLEVLVAVAILGLGLTVILSSQAGLFASAEPREKHQPRDRRSRAAA